MDVFIKEATHCRKFMQDPMEVFVDDETKLTLHGLQQYYAKLKDSEKRKYKCNINIKILLFYFIFWVKFYSNVTLTGLMRFTHEAYSYCSPQSLSVVETVSRLT